ALNSVDYKKYSMNFESNAANLSFDYLYNTKAFANTFALYTGLGFNFAFITKNKFTLFYVNANPAYPYEYNGKIEFFYEEENILASNEFQFTKRSKLNSRL